MTPEDQLHCEIAIIGGGLSGLIACNVLVSAGIDAHIFEAANRLGGRIKSTRDQHTGKYLADLGPTWVWPEYQPIAARWLKALNIQTYHQYDQGDAIIDMGANQSPMRQFLLGQHGIARIIGGPQNLIDQLAKNIGPDNIHCDYQINQIIRSNDRMFLHSANNISKPIDSNKIIVAAPLRIMEQTINWNDLLDQAATNIMQSAPTWMATQAKAVIIYKTPFWRELGLSGRIASQFGPLFEAHDHCGPDGSPAALFGFLGPSQQANKPDEIKSNIIQQLVRCFGNKAADFEKIELMNWESDNLICSDQDRQTPPAHPELLPDHIRSDYCDGRLLFAVAETATQSPGLIEGAIEAGERMAKRVLGA